VLVIRKHKIPISQTSPPKSWPNGKKYNLRPATKHFQSHEHSAAGVFSENATSEWSLECDKKYLWEITMAFHGPQARGATKLTSAGYTAFRHY
jgi:hypothetical protein